MAERQDGTDKLVNHFEVNWGAAGFDLFTDSPENCGYCGANPSSHYLLRTTKAARRCPTPVSARDLLLRLI